VAEIRGKLSHLNELAKEHNASCIIHTGNFGFFDSDSIRRISPKYVFGIFVSVSFHFDEEETQQNWTVGFDSIS
jgi:hypothetical protein